ncbi:ATP-binding cassette domain-containing protein, partial [Arthrospira platensis SPKY1]|nr:ATP-binding cassette domain-containing protein [Arthrospira platensis SPKY1]
LLNPQADPAAILRSALALGLEGLLRNHPAGLLQPLQERGRNLSGGQKQRVALVRMLNSSAPVWIMDEPTAALDAATEQVFLEMLRHYRAAGVTLIVATHSQALIQQADQILDLG